MKSKNIIAIPTNDAGETSLQIRLIQGNVTRYRYKQLSRIARANTERLSCSHDWDCCGCLCYKFAEIIRYEGKIAFRLERHYNY